MFYCGISAIMKLAKKWMDTYLFSFTIHFNCLFIIPMKNLLYHYESQLFPTFIRCQK